MAKRYGMNPVIRAWLQWLAYYRRTDRAKWRRINREKYLTWAVYSNVEEVK